MKKNLLILLLITASLWAQAPLTKEEIELERQRIQLEREKFLLEKEKFEMQQRMSLSRQNGAVNGSAPAKTPYTKDLYVGVDYRLPSSSQRTTTLNDTEEKTLGESWGYGIKLGFGAFDEHRVELTYTRVTLTLEEEDTQWDISMFSMDYLFVFHEAFGKHLSPQVKAGLAGARSNSLNKTLRAMGYDVRGDEKIEGLGLRFGMGIFYLVDESMEFSVGVDSTAISWNDTTLSYSGGSDDLELSDSIGSAYITLNYRF